MTDHEKKFMGALRTYERACRVWMAETFAKVTKPQQDQFIEACYRDTGHHASCGTFDPDNGDCDCGFEIGLRF